ncbi:hypothetical protein Back11_03650 [Paenibacillus baekrokdamisoli]|uniref:Uncharacterized protein n=1 Tax=Paenibacillus baekrokdamisoli TaxID=1712516 RepID=A0A3G9IJD7_9BACL|nr:response regulator [Paenibacillus baekrokdamisoli]MBB3067798.1 two-component system response regulator YesN [Paenibacillus baekrokdamisoli]BBH19020.1 hypothetical protein Back11_03650 [Paenibacillus baekrokdamisoli]
MHRLLIVDDEPVIVDGLMQYFQDAEQLELDVCKAYSANEALEIAMKTKIDIVICDIRMPGKSGLQLVEEVVVYWPSCRFILFTGHSEFEYVYKAIQSNVDNYILKTEGIEPIFKAVKAAVAKFDEESRKKDMLELAGLQMTAVEPLLKKEFFEALLYGENADDIWREWHFKGLTLKLDRGLPLLIVTGKVDAWDEKMSYTKKLDVFYSIQDLFAHHLSSLLIAEQIVHDHSDLVWFVQPVANTSKFVDPSGNTDWRGIVTYLKGMLETVQNGCRDLLGISLSFAVSRSAANWDDIRKEFDVLKAALKQLAFYGQVMAVVDLGMPDGLYKWEAGKPAVPQTAEFNKSLAALEKCLSTGNEAGAVGMTSELFGQIKSALAGNYLLGLEKYYLLLLAFVSHLNELNAHDKLSDDIRVASLSMMDLPVEWDNAESQFVKMVNSICFRKKEQVEKGENLLVERIHRFVHENMGADLSLARIAEAVFFNPSYLSRFYKQLTGRNLSDYINVTKTDAATHMLTNTQLKVNEIALKLGFESPSYFTAFFRKMKGATPQEYRDSHMLRK